jgi:hypothetical protein
VLFSGIFTNQWNFSRKSRSEVTIAEGVSTWVGCAIKFAGFDEALASLAGDTVLSISTRMFETTVVKIDAARSSS